MSERLTPRELDVLRLLVEGNTNAEIGRALFLSEETIKTHVRSLLAKANARSRAHLVCRAFRSGIVR